MSYTFLDASASVRSADSSIVSGVIQRPAVDIASVLSAIPVTFSGSPSISGTINVVLVAPSIVGTYAEDAASATADKGLFTLGVRNDTLSSVTSADLDYSQISTGPAGEVVTANAPLTKWIQASTSVMYGPSVLVLAAQGASIFTYVTGMQIVNDSATYSRVTIAGGSNSILGYTVAPATGGSNIVFPNALKTAANVPVTASISGVSSVYVTLQGFISKT